MPRRTPSELALRMGARSKRADAPVPASVKNEIEEVKNLAQARVLSEREFYRRLSRLGIAQKEADREWRSLNI